MQVDVDSGHALERLGACFSGLVGEHALVCLRGDLGAGKTTFVRGLLGGAGQGGAIKSPTFSLVEPYELGSYKVFHFDFYRVQDPEELEYIGMRDYLAQPGLCLVEWPEKAGGFLPEADLDIMIEKTEQGRRVRLELNTDRGNALSEKLGLAKCFHSPGTVSSESR